MSQSIKCTFWKKWDESLFNILYKITYFLLLNMNSLELRGQWGHSGIHEISWIKLYAPISEETRTMHKISS